MTEKSVHAYNADGTLVVRVCSPKLGMTVLENQEKKMSRTIIPKSEMKELGKGGWISLFGLSPEQTGIRFPSEIAARNNNKFGAAKCLRLITKQELARHEDGSLAAFCETLRQVGLENIKVQILASLRPFSYFEGRGLEHLTENYQLELPGGIVEPDETARLGALREANEEGDNATTIQCASLMDFSAPFDAGSHVEMYTIESALVYAKDELKLKAKEGIIPEKCSMVPLPETAGWLRDQQAAGIAVEGYAITALALLCGALHGGWDSL